LDHRPGQTQMVVVESCSRENRTYTTWFIDKRRD
jgi:hypothetical protein